MSAIAHAKDCSCIVCQMPREDRLGIENAIMEEVITVLSRALQVLLIAAAEPEQNTVLQRGVDAALAGLSSHPVTADMLKRWVEG